MPFDIVEILPLLGQEDLYQTCDIMIGGEKLVPENIVKKWNKNEFVDIEYPIPAKMVQGKPKITVMFEPHPNNYAAGIFGYTENFMILIIDT